MLSSDSSDDEENLIDLDFFDGGVENVGLQAESFKFTRGGKGRLITTHCNPRALKEDPYRTLSEKLKKTGGELDSSIIEFFAVQKQNKDTADGIMMSLITNSGMTKKEASHNFKIGSGRWGRLFKKQTARKGHGLNGQQILPEDLVHLSAFLASLEVELGYPCRHRKMKRYSADFDTYKNLWKAYSEFVPPSLNIQRKMQRTTFLKYLRKVHPDFALKRAKEDECDTCIRLNLIIDDRRSSLEEKNAARVGLEKHNGDSRIMRVAMQEAIKEYGKKITPSTSDNGVLENFEESVDRLPECVDDVFPDQCQLKIGGPNEGGKPIVRLQCEDYGGNFCLPWYGSQRPCIDYYLTNLTMYMFVISNLTTGINSVYLYDERAMGKNADALCSLRFVYHMRLFVEARVSKTLLSSPDTLYIVMDNCVGQNKSQVVMMFMLLLWPNDNRLTIMCIG